MLEHIKKEVTGVLAESIRPDSVFELQEKGECFFVNAKHVLYKWDKGRERLERNEVYPIAQRVFIFKG